MRACAAWVGGVACVLVLACSSAPPGATGDDPGCVRRADCGAFLCGTRDDGCGGTLRCGSCGEEQTCEASANGSACVPLLTTGSEPALHWRGRWAALPSGEVRFAFPGSGFTARFEGTEVAVLLRDLAGATYDNHLRVQLDGQPPVTLRLDAERERYVLASGLPHGVHTVQVTKLTEGFVGAVDFRGLELGAGKLLPPVAPSRRIVFLGDSATAAFGIHGHGPTCPYVPAEQDIEQGFAWRTARALAAEPIVVARSGMGWLQNYEGTRTDTAGELLRAAVPFEPLAWEPARDAAQAVVILLGDNDFAHGVPAEAEFLTAVRGVLTQARVANPGAAIVVALSPTLSDDYPKGAHHRTRARAFLQRAVAESGDGPIHFLEFSPYVAADGWGCAWQPSLAAHRRMADELTERLRTLKGW